MHTLTEAAAKCRVSEKTLRRAIQRGELLAAQVSDRGRILVSDDQLTDYLRGRQLPRPDAVTK
jgi:excisionase family DNA binding protein